MSHNAQILSHLKTGKSLTPVEALDLYGTFRLGARIHDLKAQGHAITKEMVEVVTRDGGIARVAEYSLDGKNG